MKSSIEGVYLRCADNSERKDRKKRFIVLIQLWLLMLCVFGVACDMAQGMQYFATGLSGTVIFFIELFLPSDKKRRLYAELVILLAIFVFIILFREKLKTGIFLIANQIFSVSEKLQAYQYDKFEVDVSVQEAVVCINMAVAALSFIWAYFSCIAGRKHPWIVGIAAFFLIAAAGSYYGIAPSYGWSAAFILSEMMMYSKIGDRHILYGLIRPVIFVGTMAAVVFVAVPKQNTHLSNLNEYLRDHLAVHTVYYGQEEKKEEELLEDSPDVKERQGTMERTFHYTSDIVWSGTGILIVIAAVIIVCMFAVSVFFDRLNKRAEAKRQGISDENHSIAIHAMFLYAVEWLRAGGMDAGNSLFAEWRSLLAANLSEDYAAEFLAMLVLWQEASFSNHVLGDEQRERMKDFLTKTQNLIWKRAGWREKADIRFKRALVMEEKRR